MTQPTREEIISDAIMRVVSNRDDLGYTHFIEIRDEVFAALRSAATPDARAETIEECASALSNIKIKHAGKDAGNGYRFNQSIDEAIETIRALAKDTPADGGGNDPLVPVYVKQWRTLIKVPKSVAEKVCHISTSLTASSARVEVLEALIGRPYVGAWTDEIMIEAAHQRDRWGSEQDHGKAPEDWFWLIGYLAGKALASHKSGDTAKAHHHTVSTAAVLAHWAAAIDGNEGVFRPGLGAEKIAALSKPSTEGKGK